MFVSRCMTEIHGKAHLNLFFLERKSKYPITGSFFVFFFLKFSCLGDLETEKRGETVRDGSKRDEQESADLDY